MKTVFSLANVSLVANIILVGITAWYAWLTQKLVRANKAQMDFADKQMEYQQRSYVEISAGVREGATLFQLRSIFIFYGATASSSGSLQELKDLNKNTEKLTGAVKDGLKPLKDLINADDLQTAIREPGADVSHA